MAQNNQMGTFRKHVFTHQERKSFLDILKKYSDVVEDKNMAGATVRAKKEAWDNVAREYNASPYATHQVTSMQLRRLWMNLKQRQREALTKGRQNWKATTEAPSTSNDEADAADVSRTLFVGIAEPSESNTSLALSETADLGFTIKTPDVTMEFEPPYSEPPFNVTPRVSPNNVTPSPPPSPLPPQHRPTQPPATTCTTDTMYQRRRNIILTKEYQDRKRRADEIHTEEINMMLERKREMKAKADLAELMLQQQELEINLLKERNREAKAKADLAVLVLQQKCVGGDNIV